VGEALPDVLFCVDYSITNIMKAVIAKMMEETTMIAYFLYQDSNFSRIQLPN
jgi:hypothetical protein